MRVFRPAFDQSQMIPALQHPRDDRLQIIGGLGFQIGFGHGLHLHPLIQVLVF